MAGLGFPAYVAWRYARSTRRDSYASFLSATAAGGMALGTAALILALAALSGFQSALVDEVLARTPEIEIRVAGRDAAAAMAELARARGARRAQLTLAGQGWLLAEGRIRPVELVGYSGEPPATFAGAGSGEGLWVGEILAATWGLDAGQVVEVASSRPTLTPLGPQPRSRRLAVAGVYESGRSDLVDRVALPLADAERLLAGDAYRVLVETGDLERSLALAAALERELPAGAEIDTWRELNQALFFALRLEKALMFVALFLIVVVAALALVSGVSLIIASRQREIGMLGAMGAAPRSVVRVFLTLGALLAAAGIATGAVVGIAAARLLDFYGWPRLPAGVYFVDHVPFLVRPVDVLAVVGAAAAAALLAAARAARNAAELDPVEALRR